jgi:anion-transporting  ArsA/GET3 family ATPase
MTKQELELEVASLRDKVAVQIHLASAVDAKDKEIVELKKQIELLKVEAKEGTKVVTEQQRQQIANLTKELETIRPMGKNAEQLKQQNELLTQIANGYIANFRSYLKAQQGALELAIEIEALLAEKLAKK